MTETEQAILEAVQVYFEAKCANDHGLPIDPRTKLQAIITACDTHCTEHDGEFRISEACSC